ncbi:MAG: homoserine kinase [Candidatus Nanopelagicaceae bacterium]
MSRITFRASAYEVKVPASSANLGPGFDSFAIALEKRDRYIAQVLDEKKLDIDVAGEGADEVSKDEKNLVVKAIYKGWEFLGLSKKEYPGLALRALNNLPHGRGLGSSASAIIGGLVLSRSLVVGGVDRMSDQDLLTLATEMEGHPDNVAAALFGGAVLSWSGDSYSDAIKLDVSPRISAVAFIPANNVPTSKARKMLPEMIPHQDAVKNSINTALLTQALTKRPDLLLPATEDYLHQSYREPAMPKSFALMSKLRAAGVAAFISGAGPTVLALLVDADLNHELEDLVKAAGAGFSVENLDISSVGYQVSNI